MTLANARATASGATLASGAASLVLGKAAVSGAATVRITGAGALTLGNASVSATAVLTPPVLATLHATLAPARATASGTVRVQGGAQLRNADARATGAGAVRITGAAAIVLDGASLVPAPPRIVSFRQVVVATRRLRVVTAAARARTVSADARRRLVTAVEEDVTKRVDSKGTIEQYEIGADFRPLLEEGELITSHDVVRVSGDAAFDHDARRIVNGALLFPVSQGTARTETLFQCIINTDAGRTWEQKVLLPIGD